MDWVYSPHPDLDAAIADIEKRYPSQRPAGLAVFRGILESLNNPHQKLPPVFHVAGTNGKGSTLAFMQAFLESDDKQVHKFTSPHLVRFEERIVIQGKMVDSIILLDAIRDLDMRLQDGAVSFFEFFTLIAFILFARYPADVVLLETGLGGLLDSTNVIDEPAGVLLTHVSFDHRHILGHKLADIAAQKAGIIKNGCPVTISPGQDREVLSVFTDTARRLNAPMAVAEIDPAHPAPALLPGTHQKANAATAIRALRQAGYHVDIDKGLRRAVWPGRLQQVTSGHLADILPMGTELWLDGAHNDSSIAALVGYAMGEWQDMPLDILFALKRGKNANEILSPLQSIAEYMMAVRVLDDTWMMPPESFGMPVAENLRDAISRLAAYGPRRILVTGSLYLIGQALRENEYA